MANRNNVLERFSSKFKSKKMRDEFAGGGHKKKRPDFHAQRQAKQRQWEDSDSGEE